MIVRLQTIAEPIANRVIQEGADVSEDQRCCGTGTCIINDEGVCWCGQVWDGERMCMPKAMKNDDLEEDKKTVDNTPLVR